MSITPARLDQQTIVVTGASSGTGLATARLAAERGARVVLAARDADALVRISAELSANGGTTIYVATDVSDDDQVEALAQAAIKRFDNFDTRVNNTGLGLIRTADDTGTVDHYWLFEVNYFGLVYGGSAAFPPDRQVRRHHQSRLRSLGHAADAVGRLFGQQARHQGFHRWPPRRIGPGRPADLGDADQAQRYRHRFFDHAKTNMGGMGKAPGAQCAPEVVAEAILLAAARPRREIAVGHTSALGGRLAVLAPQVIEGVQKSWVYDQLVDNERMPEAESLYEVPREGNERSRYGHGRGFSLTTSMQMHPALSMGAIALAGAALILALGNRRR